MTWILTVLVGALMGILLSLTVLLLIRYPRKTFCFGSFKWSGLIHRWAGRELKQQVAMIVRGLQPQREIENFLLHPATLDQVDAWVGNQVGDYLTKTLPEKWPMVSMLIGDKTTDKVRAAISDHIRANWSAQISSFSKQNMREEQLIELLYRIGHFDRTEQWSDQIWRPIRKSIPSLLLLSVFLGGGMAVIGRLLFDCASRF